MALSNAVKKVLSSLFHADSGLKFSRNCLYCQRLATDCEQYLGSQGLILTESKFGRIRPRCHPICQVQVTSQNRGIIVHWNRPFSDCLFMSGDGNKAFISQTLHRAPTRLHRLSCTIDVPTWGKLDKFSIRCWVIVINCYLYHFRLGFKPNKDIRIY